MATDVPNSVYVFYSIKEIAQVANLEGMAAYRWVNEPAPKQRMNGGI